MSALPFIKEMTALDYLVLNVNTLKCSVKGCYSQDVKECKKRLCPWKFCEEHSHHRHHKCYRSDCEMYAHYAYSMEERGVSVCKTACRRHAAGLLLESQSAIL
jgi:hypothetical protein